MIRRKKRRKAQVAADAEAPAAADRAERSSRRRLSPLRLLMALAALAGVGAVGVWGYVTVTADRPYLPSPWFAPYVDATLTPLFPFEDPTANPAREIVLAFVVADHDDGCIPSWGGAYTLDEAAHAIDMDRRIARVRRWGGDVVVSMGGERNQELALTCRDPERLAAAYAAVVDRYDLTTLDFDIEGGALDEIDAHGRRAEAVSSVQAAVRDGGGDLAVWLTLPSTPAGLTADGVGVIDAMLAADVDLAGVNLMVMNFGESRGDTDLAVAVGEAVEAGYRQLRSAYQRAGQELGREQLWRKIGATPMIGLNDIVTDSFDVAAAEALVALLDQRGLGRLSMWSLNRDAKCGPNIDPLTVSDHCSGLDQDPFAFSGVFGGIPGRASAAAEVVTVQDTAPPVVDDPETSPYPVWRAGFAYEADEKVVWRGDVYQAKWWNQGELPDTPVVNEWDTPWRLIGPVLPGDRPPPTTTIPPGTYEEWSGPAIYEEGSRVMWEGVAYEAKWWTQGEQPGIDVPNEWDTPWRALEGSDIPGLG